MQHLTRNSFLFIYLFFIFLTRIQATVDDESARIMRDLSAQRGTAMRQFMAFDEQ